MPVFPLSHASRKVGALALSAFLFGAALPAGAQDPAPSDKAANPVEETKTQPAQPDADPQQPTQAPPQQAPADNTVVRENHGAWSMICDQPPGSSVEQCALMQNVIADDRPEIGLSIAVLKTADREASLLRILTPLGVFLPEGMSLFVDGVDIGKAYFSRCYLDGCYVEVDIDDDLMKILRSGSEAIFTLNFSVDQNTIGIPVDMRGFADGYDALP